MKYKSIFCGIMFFLLMSTGAFGQDTVSVITDFRHDDHSFQEHNYNRVPSGIMGDMPLTHYPGPYISNSDEISSKSSLAYYKLAELLAVKDTWYKEEMENILAKTSPGKDVLSIIYNAKGYNVGVPPRSIFRAITRVPPGTVFIPMGEINRRDVELLPTTQSRIAFTGLWTLASGGDTALGINEGYGNGSESSKFDVGGNVGLIKALSIISAGAISLSGSGGKSRTEQIEPPFLNMLFGRLVEVERVRESYLFWESLYSKTGYNPNFLRINIGQMAKKFNLTGNKFFSRDIETNIIRELVFGELFKIENRGKMPAFLAEKEDKSKKAVPADKEELVKKSAYTGLHLYFDFDEYVIRQDQKENAELIYKFGQNFAKNFIKAGKPKDVRIVIGGHASPEGPNEYNIILAQNRCLAAKTPLSAGMKKGGMTDKEIDEIVFIYSGSDINTLTGNPIKYPEKERAAILILAYGFETTME